MKIYVSGKISGLPIVEVREKFEKAKRYLETLGYEVVSPLDNGLPEGATWAEHMIADIALLFTCDAIYMLSDWLSSKGAMIEKSIAQVQGMKLFFESKEEEDHRLNAKTEFVLRKVELAIQEVTGLSLNQYAINTRNQDAYFARLVFFHQCFKSGIRNRTFLGHYLKKDHATALRALKKYPDELKYNSEFRRIAERVTDVLTKAEELV